MIGKKRDSSCKISNETVVELRNNLGIDYPKATRYMPEGRKMFAQWDGPIHSNYHSF